MSINYYERNADQFFADTVAADLSQLQARFVRELPPSAHVLDAGCGSGRDAKAFADLGFHVTAFDAATEMVRRAAQHTGLPVLHMAFDDMGWTEEFDGIWASASLLHVPRVSLPSVLARCHKALRNDGILYTSFKYGSGERESDDRRFTDLTEETFREVIAEAGGLQIIELWRTGDVRPGRQSEIWLNSMVRKQG